MSRTNNLTFGQKARSPQITPVQLFILLIVEIMTMTEGLLPIFFGEDFNVIWFMVNFALNNVMYFMMMALRGVLFAGKKPMELVQQIVGNVIEILISKDSNKDEKIRRLTTLVKWIMEEINLYFEDQLNDFTKHVQDAYGDDVNELLGFKFLPTQVSSVDQLKEALKIIQKTEHHLDPKFKLELIKTLSKK